MTSTRSKAKQLFSEQELREIESAVGEAEKGSLGEIVPVVVDASSHYDWLAYRASLLGLIAGSACAAYFHFRHPFVFHYWFTFLFQALGLVSGWVLARMPWGVRFLLHHHLMKEEVHEAAHLAFIRHGLAETHARTGVLVFISLLERRVQILGDRGIHEKVGDEYWQREADKIAEGIGAGRPAQGLVEAIRGIGNTLREHFPAGQEDENELPNRVQFD
jgi:putative membrane protein